MHNVNTIKAHTAPVVAPMMTDTGTSLVSLMGAFVLSLLLGNLRNNTHP